MSFSVSNHLQAEKRERIGQLNARMSQFAHGIRSLDIQYASEQSDSIWLLGKEYTNVDQQREAYMSQFESIVWMTYRRDFDTMTPYDYTSDAGWGCMLRSAQMILCQALQRLLLGSNWRLRPDRLDPTFISVLKWFVDSPAEECIFSIHNMVKVGMQYDKLPGEWYGPTTAAQVIRDLVNLHHRESGTALCMYVPQEGVVYSDEIVELCTVQKDTLMTRDQDVNSEGVLYDPLLNPPKPTSDPSQPWNSAVLMLIPLRLGLDKLNETYTEAIQKIFEFPQSVGIIGGKRAHSVYFVGAQKTTMHILDPHTVQPTAEISATFPSATHIRTIHSSTPLVIDMAYIDPSLALGFLCRDQDDYADFCMRVETLGKQCNFPFSIANKRPDYGIELDDMISESGGESNADAEDEYVLI